MLHKRAPLPLLPRPPERTPPPRWKPDGEGHFSRTFDFMQPKKGVCSANGHCVQEQRFSVHAGGVFVMTTDMGITGIPYADSFRVQSFWKV